MPTIRRHAGRLNSKPELPKLLRVLRDRLLKPRLLACDVLERAGLLQGAERAAIPSGCLKVAGLCADASTDLPDAADACVVVRGLADLETNRV